MSAEARQGGGGAPDGAGRLAGMRAVVTGASSGIGRAIALRFAREGADVAITYRSSEGPAASVAREIEALGRRAWTHPLDLAEEEQIDALVEAAFGRFGTVDVWVNNAGADVLTGPGAELSDRDKLDLLLRVDLRGTVLASWKVAERMRAQGSGVILNMSWDHVLTGMPGRNPEIFSAVKGGILSYSRSLARSVAPEVRVGILAPGWIATAFAQQAPEAERDEVVRSTPLGRWGTPDDVARAAVFLASADAAFLTGTTLPVGGGIVM